MTDLLVLQNFINGEFTSTPATVDSFDPSTGQVHAKVPESGQHDVDLAVEAAEKAIPR